MKWETNHFHQCITLGASGNFSVIWATWLLILASWSVLFNFFSPFTVNLNGVSSNARILSTQVYNYSIRYKIPSGRVNVVGSLYIIPTTKIK